MQREILFADRAPYPLQTDEYLPDQTFAGFQAATNENATYHDKTSAPNYYTALGFADETVEFSGSKWEYALVLMTCPPAEEIPENIRMGMMFELGDMLWYLTQRAENEGLQLGDVAWQQCAEQLLMFEPSEELTLDSYQSLAMLLSGVDTVRNKWNLDTTARDNPFYLLMRRMSELVQASTDITPAQPTSSSRAEQYTAEESIGNALYMVAFAANMLEVPLSQVAAYNTAKLQSRQRRGVQYGEGDYR